MLSVKKWNRSEISDDRRELRVENWSLKLMVSLGGLVRVIWGGGPGFG